MGPPVMSVEHHSKGVCGCGNTLVGIEEEDSFVSDRGQMYSVLCLSVFHTSVGNLCTAFVIDLIADMLSSLSFLKHHAKKSTA